MTQSLLPALTKGVLSPQRICNEYLHLCSHPTITQLNPDDYIDGLLSHKPLSIQDNNFINNLYQKIAEDPNPRETIRSI
jgi:hypothetical protein